MTTINVGLLKIEVGALEADGGESTAYEVLGNTLKDSASITQEDNETHEFEVEEEDEPIGSVLVKKGTTTIKWELVEWEASLLVKLFGGTATAGVWEEPDQMTEPERSIRITPRVGNPFTYPRCKLNCKIEYEANRTGIARIVVSAKKLKPTKAGEPAFKWG